MIYCYFGIKIGSISNILPQRINHLLGKHTGGMDSKIQFFFIKLLSIINIVDSNKTTKFVNYI